jgi:hypothetical protein
MQFGKRGRHHRSAPDNFAHLRKEQKRRQPKTNVAVLCLALPNLFRGPWFESRLGDRYSG